MPPLSNSADDSAEGNRRNFDSLQREKEEKITFATRAPASSDKGRLWFKYTAGGSSMIAYVRHPTTGAWLTGPTYS